MAKRSRLGCIARIAWATGSVTDARTVKSLVYLRHALDRGEALVVFGVVAAQRADVVQRARLQAEQVAAVHQLGVDGILIHLGDHRLVEPGRQHVDQLHARDELAVLLGGDLAGHEDTKVPDAVVQRVDNRLAVRDDLALVVVEIENPVQRLLRWRDVVAP